MRLREIHVEDTFVSLLLCGCMCVCVCVCADCQNKQKVANLEVQGEKSIDSAPILTSLRLILRRQLSHNVSFKYCAANYIVKSVNSCLE